MNISLYSPYVTVRRISTTTMLEVEGPSKAKRGGYEPLNNYHQVNRDDYVVLSHVHRTTLCLSDSNKWHHGGAQLSQPQSH